MILFTMSVDLDNSAFEDPQTEGGTIMGRQELRRILFVAAEKVAMGISESACLDSNGNSVGSWSVE